MTTLRESVLVRSSLLQSINGLGLPDQEEAELLHMSRNKSRSSGTKSNSKRSAACRSQALIEPSTCVPSPTPPAPPLYCTVLQPEEKERLQEIRRMPLPPSRGTFDLGSSVDTDQLITLNRKVKADGGTLHCIVLSLEPSQVHGPNQSFDTSLIAS